MCAAQSGAGDLFKQGRFAKCPYNYNGSPQPATSSFTRS